MGLISDALFYVPSLLFRTCPALLCLRYQPSCPWKTKKLSEGKETPCLSLYKSDLFDPGQLLNTSVVHLYKNREMIPDPPTSESTISYRREIKSCSGHKKTTLCSVQFWISDTRVKEDKILSDSSKVAV